MKYKIRNSNIELLRILCMIAIIIHHSFCHSVMNTDWTNINYNILYIIQILGPVSNNIFILITGYYMVNKQFNKKTFIKIVVEVLFYSYFALILNLVFFKQTEDFLILNGILPITSSQEWFITCYLLLYISIPFLNILINNLNRKQLAFLIIILLCCFSVFPTMLRLIQYFSTYTWFICLYLIGAYINRYKESCYNIISKSNILLLISSIVLLVLMVLKSMLGFTFIMLDINNFIMFVLGFSIFVFFINKKAFNNSMINYIASSVLGIYLIHDNFILRPEIWNRANIGKYLETPYFWIYEIGVVLFIFCICFIIDKARQKLIEKPVLAFIYNKIDKTEEKLNNKENTTNKKGEILVK